MKQLTSEQITKNYVTDKLSIKLDKLGMVSGIYKPSYADAFEFLRINFNIQHSVEPSCVGGDDFWTGYTYVEFEPEDVSDVTFSNFHDAQKWCLKELIKLAKKQL